MSVYSGSNIARDCYWDLQSSGMATDPVATGKTTAAMKSQATYYRWNFHNQWSIEEGISYPHLEGLLYYAPPAALTIADLMGSGTITEPYVIMTADQLNVMRQAPSACFALGADIALEASVAWNYGRGWEAIGSTTAPFTGTFEGNGYTISGLCLNRPKNDYQGLFGFAEGATIRRVNLSNCHILGQSNVGGAVGYARASQVDETVFDGTMLAFSATGGIAGVVESGSLQRCYSEIDLISFSEYAGGLVGYITGIGTVSNSGCTGSVAGLHNVGGLVGMVAWGNILNSYSHASVRGTYHLGGFVGIIGWSNPGQVSRCYSTGLISPNPGSDNVGGFTGRFQAGTILESFWDVQSSGMTTSSGTGATGLSTAAMMQEDSFVRWNFSTLWQMGSRGYPTHRDLSVYALPVALTTDDLPGSGTIFEPYVIQTIDQLNVMHQALDAHFVLNMDLDLSATCVWNGGLGWEPVGTATSPFTGTFNGAGNELSHLFIERPEGDNAGLFGYISNSKISNIEFSDLNIHARDQVGAVAGYATDSRIDLIAMQGIISGKNYTGGIAGSIYRSIIQRCKADLTNWALYYHAGGIVALVSSDTTVNSTVSTCESTGYVRAYLNAGGLIGYLYFGSLINSASHATVQAYAQNGGAVGTCGWDNPSSIVRSYSTGLIITEAGGYENYGLVGRFQSGQVYDCYWDTTSSGSSFGGPSDAIGLSSSEMKQQASYNNWDFDSLWQISEGIDYPSLRDLSALQDPATVSLAELMGSGTEGDPYLITSPDQLNAIRQNLSAHYLIHDDLDLTGTLIWNGGRGWLPLGSPATPFTGSINGNGKTIYGLSILAPLTHNVGLISSLQNGAINNLHLTGLSLVAEDNAGALAGSVSGSSITGVIAESRISGRHAIGGLFGVVSGGTIEACKISTSIRARNAYIGGLAGTINQNAQISQCSSTGTVEAFQVVGGLLGELYYGVLSDCYSHIDVTASVDLGGAVGRIGWDQPGQLVRCYSTGAVIVNDGGYYYGGLVGRLASGTVSASYWDMDSSGMSTSSGAGATGLTTAQMTYPGSVEYFDTWDFAETWAHDNSGQNSGYPLLAWQLIPVPDAVQNLSITYVEEQLLLEWQAVTGAACYKVYASEDPYAPWNEWSYIGQSSGTTYLTSVGQRRFFMVRAVGE